MRVPWRMPFHLSCSGWLFRIASGILYPPWIRSWLETVGWHLPQEGQVLDVGGGTGTMGRIVASSRNLPLWIADPAIGMIRHASTPYRILARGESLPLRHQTFSCVTVGEALHHIHDVEQALTEMVRVLEPEGILCVYEFNPSTFLGKGLHKIEMIAGEPGHFYPPQELSKKVQQVFPGAQIGWVQRGFRYLLLASRRPVAFLDKREAHP